MLINPMPAWNSQGFLPPVNLLNPVSAERAPYLTSLTELVQTFGSSKERVKILEGFLDYRAALHAIGMDNGFQWIDGSFLEDVESIRSRPPKDIDISTFYRFPANVSRQAELFQRDPSLFPANLAEKEALKDRLKVDVQYTSLEQSAEKLVEWSIYWYGVWAHQRDTFLWKGFVQIDLNSGEDAKAKALLSTLPVGGVNP